MEAEDKISQTKMNYYLKRVILILALIFDIGEEGRET